MPSPLSSGPSDARGRRSSAFVHERHAPIGLNLFPHPSLQSRTQGAIRVLHAVDERTPSRLPQPRRYESIVHTQCKPGLYYPALLISEQPLSPSKLLQLSGQIGDLLRIELELREIVLKVLSQLGIVRP